MDALRLKSAEDVFHLILEAPAAQRASILAETCGGDRELRAFVEQLLAHHDAGLGEFLQRPVVGFEFRGLSGLAAKTPERIGRYTVLRRLGEGGMSIVYEAQQDHPHRTVALKVIRPGIASESLLRRFQFEAELLGRLQHPGIAAIHDAGVADVVTPGQPMSRQPFFAMELIRGRSLNDFATEQNLSVPNRLGLFIKVCEAVQYAHAQGVVHRDLKPANVLVDAHQQPKVLDFGVARVTDADVQATTMHTEVGQWIGTLPYMSPEQVGGDAREVDFRADIYALGVILYELLAGRLPYNVTGRTLPEAARIIREEEPTRLGTVHTRLRGDLETIVAKALEKEKTRRYASAADLAADVRRYLNNEPITARPPSTIYQIRKFARRNRVAVIGLAAVFVVLIGGLVSTSYGLAQALRAREAEAEHRKQAEESESAAITARDEARSVTQFLTDMLRAVSPGERSVRSTVREVLDQAATNIGEKFPGRPLVEARVRYAIGWSYAGQGAYNEAQTQLAEAAAIFQREKGEPDRETFTALTSLAIVFNESGQYGKSEAQAKANFEVQRRTLGEEHPETLLTKVSLGWALLAQGRYAEAERLYAEAAEVQARRRGEESPETLETMNHLGIAIAYQGRYAEAETIHRKTVATRLRVLGENHPTLYSAMHNLATVVNKLGRFAEAEELHRRTLAGTRRLRGESHPHTLRNLDDLARCLIDQGRASEAEPLAREALEGFRKISGQDHSDTFEATLNVAAAVRLQGRSTEAAQILDPLVLKCEQALGADHPLTLDVLDEIASVHLAEGRLGEAESTASRAVEVRMRVQGSAHPSTGRTLLLLAEILMRRDSLLDAEDRARRGYDILLGGLGPTALATRDAAKLVGDVLNKQGRSAEAKEWDARSRG